MKKIVLSILAIAFAGLLHAQKYNGSSRMSEWQRLNDEYCTGLFHAYDGTIIDLTNHNESAISYRNILNWLQGRVAGLQIYYTWDMTPVPVIRNSLATIFVDEMPVGPRFLDDLSVADIAIIKIIKEPFAGAIGNGGGGVIAIYTLKGDEAEEGVAA
jgi:hypothetical protein